MREIKFRAWQVNTRKMLLDSTFLNYQTMLDFNSKNYIMLQYTGLKDKNGVEIYEGDIVKEHFGAYGEVKYVNGCFILQLVDARPLAEYIICDFGNKTEVIGNIYENKELLNV